MSSFVLLTQHGPPDLIVEIGSPISSDPVLLSGLFKAIMSFTDEVTQAPLKVLQTKGFTVQFKSMFDDYVLIVGTNHTILGLETVLEQIGDLIYSGFEHDHDPEDIESEIRDVLENYVEYSKRPDTIEGDSLPEDLKEMFDDIPLETYRIIFFGLLAGFRLKFPKTTSMDLNRNTLNFIEYLDQTCCSQLDPDCVDSFEILGKNDKFRILKEEYTIKDAIKKTKLIEDLMDLVRNKKYEELKLKLISELGTLGQMTSILTNFNPTDYTETEREEIDQLRYLIGHELEYYLLLRLNRKDKSLVDFIQKNTIQTEWMSSW